MRQALARGRSARYKKRPRIHLSPNRIIQLAVATALLTGIFTGSIAGCSIGAESLASTKATVTEFLLSFGETTDRLAIFSSSAIKDGKIILAIWLLAFVPVGRIVSVLIVFAKGIGYGFTTALLMRCYGALGAFYGSLMYLPQSLILIPAYIFVTYGSIRFALPDADAKDRANARTFLVYMLYFLIGCTCIVLSALIEAWLSPMLISGIIAKLIQ